MFMLRNIFALCLVMAFFACKKSRQPQPQHPQQYLQGTWTGRYGYSYGNDEGDTTFGGYFGYFEMDFARNGDLVVRDIGNGQTMTAKGQYELKDKKLYARYKYIQGNSEFSFRANLERPDSLGGKWLVGYDGPTGGEFYLKK